VEARGDDVSIYKEAHVTLLETPVKWAWPKLCVSSTRSIMNKLIISHFGFIFFVFHQRSSLSNRIEVLRQSTIITFDDCLFLIYA